MKTISTTITNGVQTVFPVSFALGYIDKAHVFVYTGDVYTEQTGYTWVNETTIETNSVLPAGTTLNIRRVVPKTALINDYTNNAILEEQNLDQSFKQAMMWLEEIDDGFVTATPEWSVQNTLRLQNDLDMAGKKILNLPAPVAPTDLVRLQDTPSLVTAAQGANYVGETAPVSAFHGMRWYTPTLPATFVYYVDGDSGQWVEEAHEGIDGGLRADLAILPSLKSLRMTLGLVQTTASFHSGYDIGGGRFYYDPTKSKSLHNGGTVIAPEAVNAWDGTPSGLGTLLNWTGSGSGCYVRLEDEGNYQVETFGGLRSPALCTESMQKLLDTYGVMKGVPSAEYVIRRVWFNRPVYIDLNRCTVRGDVFTTSGFRADSINGIQVINGTLLHTKTLGVYVQAFTFNNCQNVLLEDLLIDGFSQFSIYMGHLIAGEYSGFTLRRVKVHNAGNFFADASAIANCLEFINRDVDSIRTDTIIEDCEFFLMDGAKGNIAKFGVCRDTQIKRTRFKCIDRTAVGSSGIQSGATGNALNHLNKVTLEDCNIHCVNTLDGYYAYDGVGKNTFIRSSITGDGGSIYNPPKGSAAQEWIFIDSNIVGLFLYDNPINNIAKIHLKNSYVYRFKLEKDESVVDPTACLVSKFIMDNSKVDQLNFNCTMPSIKVFGAESYVPYLGLAVTDVDIGLMEFSDRAVIGDLVYTTTNGSIEKIVIDNAVLKKVSLRDNNLNHLLIKNSELQIGGGFEWYVNGLLSCNVINNLVVPNPDSAPTTATNLLSFYSNGNCNGNTFDNIPNRSFYVTAANCFVKAVNNIYNKSNYAPYATIGSGEVRNYNCIMNEILMPFSFRSLPQSIAATPIAHGQMALVGGKWYQAIGTTAPTDWKQSTN